MSGLLSKTGRHGKSADLREITHPNRKKFFSVLDPKKINIGCVITFIFTLGLFFFSSCSWLKSILPDQFETVMVNGKETFVQKYAYAQVVFLVFQIFGISKSGSDTTVLNDLTKIFADAGKGGLLNFFLFGIFALLVISIIVVPILMLVLRGVNKRYALMTSMFSNMMAIIMETVFVVTLFRIEGQNYPDNAVYTPVSLVWPVAAMMGLQLLTVIYTAGKTIGSNATIYAILVIMSIIWLYPFFCIVMQSFRVEKTWQVGYVLPKQWGLDNFKRLFDKETGFMKWYANTLIIALVCSITQTVIVLCMSYTLSRFRFKLRKPLMQFMLILGLFPGMLSMIILYRVLKDLGLTMANSVPGLILVYIASSGMGYYISKGFFDTISTSLDEAARVDGATRLQVLINIILPLSKPIVIYTILTAFMGPWGDFVFAQYIAFNTSEGMNVAVGLKSWLSQDAIDKYYTTFCAGGVVVAIPVAILFLCLQKYYVEGVTGGSVKG